MEVRAQVMFAMVHHPRDCGSKGRWFETTKRTIFRPPIRSCADGLIRCKR